MAHQSKKRRGSVISISSGGPTPKRRGPVICISSDEGSQAKKRAAAARPVEGKEKSPTSKSIGHRSRVSFDYGDSDDEDLLAATRQLELLRSWVDAGIEMAIREMKGDQRYSMDPVKEDNC